MSGSGKLYDVSMMYFLECLWKLVMLFNICYCFLDWEGILKIFVFYGEFLYFLIFYSEWFLNVFMKKVFFYNVFIFKKLKYKEECFLLMGIYCLMVN